MDNGEFLFIDESGLRSEASRKRQVRSFAARNARGRKQRVREYQDSKSRESGHQQTTTANEISTVMVRSDKDQDVIPAGHSHLSTNLSAARTDPFDSFSRKVSQSEWFLFDHCKFHPHRLYLLGCKYLFGYSCTPRHLDCLCMSSRLKRGGEGCHSQPHGHEMAADGHDRRWDARSCSSLRLPQSGIVRRFE